MKAIKLYTLIFTFLLLSINSFAQMKNKNHALYEGPLLGTWQTLHADISGTYLRLDFKKDHSFSYFVGSQWEGTYKKSGNKIIHYIYFKMLRKSIPDTTIILNIVPDKLVIVDKSKVGKVFTSELTRTIQTHSKSKSIVGTWETDNYNGNPATITYGKDGAYTLKETLRTFDGFFIASKDSLTVYSGYQKLMEMKPEFIGKDKLYLINSHVKGNNIIRLEKISN
jgi:hypothetical protein